MQEWFPLNQYNVKKKFMHKLQKNIFNENIYNSHFNKKVPKVQYR